MDNDFGFSKKLYNSSNIPSIKVISPPDIQRNESIKRITIFTRTKSNSKNNNILFFKKNTTNSNNPLHSSTKKKRTFRNFDTNYNEVLIKDIYKNQDDGNYTPKLVQKFLQVEECSILEYGLKNSVQDIDFSFCRTCDPNLINPICLACLKVCHSEHRIQKKVFRGQIKCICGERLHCISKKPNLTINNVSCQLGEWYTISKLNFYYNTNDNKCLCMLCYNFCNNDKNKKSIKQIDLKNNNKIVHNCCCNNDDIHQERKVFLEKMEKIAHKLDTFEYFNLLHPSQIINMIFLSKNQFNFNYADLNFFNEILFNVELIFFKNADFTTTNYYLICNHLIEFIKWNKNTDITYYCKEAENYFSFKNAKLVLSLMNIMKFNEKFFWLLSSKFLKLFHKIYIGNLTQSFSKFKLNDLENFSCSQRSLLRNSNKKNFPESQEIIKFLINSLENINLKGFSIIEALDTINIIVNILKKLSIYDLFNNGDMIRVIYEIEKILFDVKSLRKISFKINQTTINNKKNKSTNYERMSILVQKSFEMFYEKELKLYINIIKLISNFNLSFNDRLIYNPLTNIQKYPTLDTINKDTISFSFIKTDLGRAIIRLTLRIVYSIQNAYAKFSYDEKFKYIMNQGMRIFSCYLTTNDIFLLSIMQNIKNVDFYKKGDDFDSNDPEYDTILKQNNNLEKTYKNFFMFENDFEDVIQEVNHTIDVILENNNNNNETYLKLSDKIILCILKSNYYYTLSKFYQILNFAENKKEKLPKYLKSYGILKDNEEIIEKITNKIFLFFNSFIYNSSDNSLLLMSNYIFNDLCKAPIKYGTKNMELFLESTKNIINKSRIIGNIKNYLINLFTYLEYLKNKSYSKIIDCLLIYLNIIELLVLNIKTLNPDESIKIVKEIMIEINRQYKIVNNFFENNSIDNDDEGDKYQNILISYIKIINDIFDFTIEGDKTIVLSILKTGKIIDYLKNHNMNIVLRTEFLQYIRKVYIDLSYDANENSNQIYANSIISTDDNLVLLKTNPLISNFRYPTKLLSFFKDFLNLSVRSETKEKCEKETINVNPNKNYTFQFQHSNKNEDESSNVQMKINDKNIEEIEAENEDDEDSEGKNSFFSKSKSSNTGYYRKKKIFKPCFDNNIYELIMNELKNIKEITSDINKDDNIQMDNLRNYFENGLLIPIIFFVKRSFVFSHLFSGREMILLYDLIIESCKLRLYIAEYKYDFWKEITEENIENNNNLFKDEEENICKIYNNKGYLIDGSFCVNNILNISTNNALNLLKEKLFLCFDYTFLYSVFEENIFSLLKDRKVNIYREFFINEGKEISVKMIIKEENKLFPDYNNLSEIKKRNIRLYILYKNCKKIISNENNSSLLSILPEICLEHETNYRNLLITFLINICINSNLYNEYTIKSFSLLYKLLCLQTSETQNNLINLIGGNDADENDLGFLTQFGQHLFKSTILLFIELFNPPDKLLDKNYSSSFLLIKIFKYLCEEHNNFFQCRLIKSLQYKYEEIIPIFYKELSKETESKLRSNFDNDDFQMTYITKNIKFFDFFLHVILKIILISEWDKLDYNNENYHPQNLYLYDLFDSILEMLNEIIQGNRPEYLNNLGNSIIDNKIEIDNLIDDDEYYLIKSAGLIKVSEFENEENKGLEKIDHFRYFVKNVTNFIFSDKISLELLYKIRNNLMEFFTTILEEKNCNDEVQKFVIKYLNINRVFNSISSILKSYYLRESSDVEIQNLLKSLKLEETNLAKNLYGKPSKTQITKNGTSTEFKKINSAYSDKYGTKIKFDYSSNLLPKTKKNFMRTLRQREKGIIFNEKLLEYYRNLYFTIKEFNQTNEFKLANAFYKYIKLIIALNKSDEAKQIIEHAQSMSEERAKRKFLLGEPKKIDTISISKKEVKILNKLSSKTLTSNIGNKRTIKTNKANKTLYKKSLFYNNNLDNSELFILSNKKLGIIDKEKKIGSNQKKSFNAYKKNERKMILPLINENKNEYDRDFIEHYYIIKFFESITTTVEVRTAGAVNQTVIFTQPPEMIYLSSGTKSEFEREVNRDSETSKKNYLVRNVIYFQKEIKYYQRYQSNLSRLVSKFDFLYIQMASYIYALLFNLFILFTLNGDIKLSVNEIEEESIKSRRTNHKGIQTLIDKSVNKWRHYYDIICYIYVILNGACIFIWIYFRMPLYYKIDRLKYVEENNIQNKKSLKFYQKFYIILVMTIYDRDYISTLIYEFIFSLIGAIMEKGEIIYAFLLLPIIDLNNILKNIIVSVKLQYNEVCLTFFFAAIIMYAFSNIAYFFFKKDFAQEIEYKDDNVCSSLIFCFLNTLDSGLRARGGIADSAIRLSYSRNKKHYILRLIVDDIFFLLIVITAIDLVFGIILGAFSTLRNIEQKHYTDRKNHCFICHVNKNTLEKNSQNFNEHRTKIHNLWNYVDYMITLKFSDVHSLNAINSYANEKIINKDISWLPTYKDLKNNEKKNDDLEEELKVEEENLNKYFVKTC